MVRLLEVTALGLMRPIMEAYSVTRILSFYG